MCFAIAFASAAVLRCLPSGDSVLSNRMRSSRRDRPILIAKQWACADRDAIVPSVLGLPSTGDR